MTVRAFIFYFLATSFTSIGLAGGEMGPAAALSFAAKYRGEICRPGERFCYPEARGIPFTDAEHFVEMSSSLWRPVEIAADFNRRMKLLPEAERKKAIVVILKTERCATKLARLCSVTTAVFEKEATPIIHRFALYGMQLKPRDGDMPPGSQPIEIGEDEWKNQAAGEYRFVQGPGATIVVLNPKDGSEIAHTDAFAMHLLEAEFVSSGGQVPYLEQFLSDALSKLYK